MNNPVQRIDDSLLNLVEVISQLSPFSCRLLIKQRMAGEDISTYNIFQTPGKSTNLLFRKFAATVNSVEKAHTDQYSHFLLG